MPGLSRAAGIGRLLEWSAVDRCLLVAVIALPIVTSYAVAARVLFLHRQAFPWIDIPSLELAISVQNVLIAAWLAVIVSCIFLRRRRPESRWMVYVTSQLYFVGTLGISSFLGLHANNLVPFVLLAGAAVGSMLFDRRPIVWGMAAFVLGFAVMTAAEQAGWIREAPLLRIAPLQHGHLDRSWLASVGALNAVALLTLTGVICFIVDRWRERELQLEHASDQLSKANELISRYVATQVAQQIQAGNYSAVNRHVRCKLTVFFSDIKGFTEIADTIEPEDLSRILNEYLSEMTEIAERYEATVDKFVGDAILIFFGAPVSTDDRDHAIRAVRMAIAMQGRIRQLRTKWMGEGLEEPFEVRIGINTGQASVGNFGSRHRMDYTAIGRQVNLAARLQISCDPGKILLSQTTWALVHDEIPCIDKGELQIKGFHQRVKVYEVAEAAHTAPVVVTHAPDLAGIS